MGMKGRRDRRRTAGESDGERRGRATQNGGGDRRRSRSTGMKQGGDFVERGRIRIRVNAFLDLYITLSDHHNGWKSVRTFRPKPVRNPSEIDYFF